MAGAISAFAGSTNAKMMQTRKEAPLVFCTSAALEVRASCCRLSRRMEPGSTILNLNSSGSRWNGALWHTQGEGGKSSSSRVSAGKVMFIFILNEEGLIMNFEPRGTTRNSDHCTETCSLNARLRRSTRKMSEVWLHHNAGYAEVRTRNAVTDLDVQCCRILTTVLSTHQHIICCLVY